MMIWKTAALLALALCAQGRRIPLDEIKRRLVNEEVKHGKLVNIGSHETKSHEGYGWKVPLDEIKRQLVNAEAPHGKLVHIGSHEIKHHEGYAPAYPKYEFSYSVYDPHTHDEKAQKESRDGDEVKGEYWLVQPDGKKRTVTYHSDKHTGYKAHVEYSHHHRPIEEVIIPIVEQQEKEKEPQHDLIRQEESDESSEKSSEVRQEVKEEDKSSEEEKERKEEKESKEEKERKDEKEREEEKQELPENHRSVVQREYHSEVVHPIPIYKKDRQEHNEPKHRIPDEHERREEDEENKRDILKELNRSRHGSQNRRKTPVLRYTKVGEREIDQGPVKPVLVDSITDAERRYDVDSHLDRPRLYRPRLTPNYHSRYYRDSRQKKI